MAKSQALLSHQQVLKVRKPGRYRDGHGLYLQVTQAGVKSWIVRYMICGRARHMGIGPFPAVGLAEARQLALSFRNQIRLQQIDPLEARAAQRAANRLARAKQLSFKACAEAFIDTYRAGCKNEKHAWQWTRSLELYVYPIMGDVPVGEIDTPLVIRTLEPIWNGMTETASRIRGRIEKVLGYAITAGYREGQNPARWKGHLENLLPKPSSVAKVENQPALPWAHIPAFMARLRRIEKIPANALELTILTASRTSEVLGARWNEIDFEAGVWTVPAARMKTGREHRVPLSPGALSLLRRMQDLSSGNDSFVFPGAKPGKSLSNMSMLMTLRRMERSDITVHGFRSTFRDWTAEETDTPRDVAAMALAHLIPSKVEAAYRRGDLFEKRRVLMDAWAIYCDSPAPVLAFTPGPAKSSVPPPPRRAPDRNKLMTVPTRAKSSR